MSEFENDMQSNEDDDPTPFTLVSPRKDRATGIPIMFKASNPMASFWLVNPNNLAAEIVAVAQEKLLSHQFTKDGSLVVNVSSLTSANKLLAITALAGIPCTSNVPASYSRSVGKITGVPREYKDEQLLEYLKDTGVTTVRRQASYIRNDDETITVKLHESVILTFRPDKPMPTKVFLGFTSHPVQEYFGVAMQCFRCQKHGHMAKYCKGPQKCKICAGSHSHKDCSLRRQPCCANCGGPHPASYSLCPSKKAATSARYTEIKYGKSPKRKPTAVNPDFVKPTVERNLMVNEQNFPHLPNNRKQNAARHQQESSQSSEIRRPTPAPRSPRPAKQKTPEPYQHKAPTPSGSLEQNPLLTMLFVALKAIIRSLPGASDLAEVQALLSMETVLKCSVLHEGLNNQHYG